MRLADMIKMQSGSWMLAINLCKGICLCNQGGYDLERLGVIRYYC